MSFVATFRSLFPHDPWRSLHAARVAIGDWIDRGLDLAYPSRCANCGEERDGHGIGFCDKCQPIASADDPCHRCGSFVPKVARDEQGCPNCRRRRYRFSNVICLAPYEGVLREELLRLKRPRHETLAFALADALWTARRAELEAFAPHVVAPIPMHWRHRLARGTNGAELLAERLAKRLGIPYAKALRRRRATDPQVEYSPNDRRKNVRGAMSVRITHRFHDARVLIVDDILTSGATCNEAARALRRAGAKKVAAVVIGRALSPQ